MEESTDNSYTQKPEEKKYRPINHPLADEFDLLHALEKCVLTTHSVGEISKEDAFQELEDLRIAQKIFEQIKAEKKRAKHL